MRSSRIRTITVLALLAALAAPAALADDLAAAYAGILNGDYLASRAAATKVLADDEPAARRVLGWLDSYSEMNEKRGALREATLAWSSEQAQKAAAEGRLFLALTFTARAAEYAEDKGEFAGQDWVSQILEQGLARARELEAEPKWRDALSYYYALERILEKDEQLKQARMHAAAHARLEALYPDKAALERRIKGVRREMFYEALRKIDALYYKQPDYKAMAIAAMQSLDALYETPKLFNVFDGLANPDTRHSFTSGLNERRADIEKRDSFGKKELQRLFDELVELNRKTVDLPEGLLVMEFTDGAVTKLDDFTSMIWPSEANDFDKMLTGDFCGVGISLGLEELSNRLKVVTPLEDSPALEAGILPNDLIIEVDGESTKDWTTEDAVRRITGKPKTRVALTIFRPATGERLEFPLMRREIHLRSVEGYSRLENDPSRWNYIVDGTEGVAYIRLSSFSPRSADELTAALEAAQQQGMRGLVLDLRYNPGGLLEAAVDIVGKFLNNGHIVSTRGRPNGPERPERYEVDGKAPYNNLPLIVLVNDNSASASEILSGAFRDLGRAVILGERTFGKGSVQKVIPLDSSLLGARHEPGARIKLTTALYYLPSGRSPHKSPDADVWGVDPDWTIKLTPKEAVKVIEQRRDSAILRSGGKTEEPTITEEERKKNLEALKAEKKDEDGDEPLLSEEDIALIESDPTKAAPVDPQLEYALLHLRAKLAGNMPWPKLARHVGK